MKSTTQAQHAKLANDALYYIGDILKLIQWAYQKNHFLSEDERFEVAYYLPVRLK